MKNVIRHGDVSLHEVDPSKIDQSKFKKLTGGTADYPIAFGETTGHKHVLKAGEWKLENMFAEGEFEVYEAGDKTVYVKVNKPTALVHEEHKTIVVPPGLYEQKQEREEDPFSEAAAEQRVRRVVD